MENSAQFSDLPEDIKKLIIPEAPYSLALSCRENWKIWKKICFVAKSFQDICNFGEKRICYAIDTLCFEEILGLNGSERTYSSFKQTRYIRLTYGGQIDYIIDLTKILMVEINELTYLGDAVSLNNKYPDQNIHFARVIVDYTTYMGDVKKVFKEKRVQEVISMCSYKNYWLEVDNSGEIIVEMRQAGPKYVFGFYQRILEKIDCLVLSVCPDLNDFSELLPLFNELRYLENNQLKKIVFINYTSPELAEFIGKQAVNFSMEYLRGEKKIVLYRE